MGSHGLRFEAELPLDQVAVLLHQTADALAEGCLRLGEDQQSLDELREVSISLRRRGQDLRLRIQATPRTRSREAGDRRVYRAHKQRMRRSFKALQRQAGAHELPAVDQLGTFLDQGQRMMRFPDKGPEFYPAFARGLESLREAVQAGDVGGFVRAMARIDVLRKAAHRRHR
jgi:XXXCH domain-containing protein